MKTGFVICNNKGFQLLFPNGVTLSTQFGGGNYCSNYNAEINFRAAEGSKCENAEIAAFLTDGGAWITQEVMAAAGLPDPGDDVAGHIGMEDWLKLVTSCAAYKVTK